METPAYKPSEAETGLVNKSPQKPSSSSSSVTSLNFVSTSTPMYGSRAASLDLSTNMEAEDPMAAENPEEGYILLDECFSGPSPQSPVKSTLPAVPSPGNAVEYQNWDSSNDRITWDDLPSHQDSVKSSSSNISTTGSVEAVVEGMPVAAQPEVYDSTDTGISECQSAASTMSLELTGHSKYDDGHLPPALPAKMSAVLDAEHNVPASGSVRGAASHPTAPSGEYVAPFPCPRPHMVSPMQHRYVNAAPVPVRHQATAGSTKPKNSPVSSASAHLPVGANASSLLPPRAHGQLHLISIQFA